MSATRRRSWTAVRIEKSTLEQIQILAKRRGISAARVVDGAVQRLFGRLAFDPQTTTPDGAAPLQKPAKTGPLLRLEITVSEDEARRFRAFATRKGLSMNAALVHLVDLGLEAEEHRDGIPPSRVDELVEELVQYRQRLESLGPSVLGMIRVLAAWAARSGELGVGEEELLQELEATGRDEWESALDLLSKRSAPVIGASE